MFFKFFKPLKIFKLTALIKLFLEIIKSCILSQNKNLSENDLGIKKKSFFLNVPLTFKLGRNLMFRFV